MKPEQALNNLGNAIKKHGTPICMETDPEAWFPDAGCEGGDFRKAVKLCQACPVQVQCAIYGIVSGDMYGVWGGLTVRARQAVRNGHMTLKEALEGKKLPRNVVANKRLVKVS